MAHGTDTGYMRKYLNVTAGHRKWLEDKLTPHRDAHRAAILAAEERYRVTMSAPLGIIFENPNRSYWDRVRPMIEGHVITAREQRASRILEDECHAADVRFHQDTETIHAIFNSRTKQAIARATGRGT